MKLRPLIIDTEVKARIADLVANAEKNVFSMDDLLDVFNAQAPVPGDRKGFSVILPFDYRIVYTLEKQTPGLVKHLSVSVNEEGALPSPDAVREIMELIGFKNGFMACKVEFENIGPNREAINIMEVIE